MEKQPKDLRKLNRVELLELLVELSRENDRLKEELDAAKQELADRTLKLESAGTMAEAALALNGVFAAVDAACVQYLESVEAKYASPLSANGEEPEAVLSSEACEEHRKSKKKKKKKKKK